MEEKIKVSVIIPVYNAERYLRQCLDSVVNQTLQEIEIICVNDGSWDNSLQILEEYADKDSRITIISQSNAGQSAARNAALDTAAGRYVYMLDSDDYLDADALKELYARCEKDSLDALLFDAQCFYDDPALKDVFAPPSSRKGYDEVYTGVELMSKMRDNSQYLVTVWRAIYRREFLERNHISFLNGIIHEDELFSFYVMMNAERVSHVDKEYYHRRIRQGSTMTTPKSFKNVYGYFSCMEQMLCYGLSQDWPELKENEIWRAFSAELYLVKRIYGQLSDSERQKVASLDKLSRLLFDKLVLNGSKIYGGGSAAPNEAARIRSSVSYRIGRSITFIPRKIREGYKLLFNRFLVR